MTAEDPSLALLPIDPTFPPAVYARTSRLLRSGVVGFFLLASAGMIAGLWENPTQTVSSLVTSNPVTEFGSVGTFLSQLFGFAPGAVITLGIFVMVAVTIGRVIYAAVDFYRGRERLLAGLSATVVALLILGLFIVAPFVH